MYLGDATVTSDVGPVTAYVDPITQQWVPVQQQSSGVDLSGLFGGLNPTALILIVGLAALLFLKK